MPLPIEAARAAANDDPEFRIAARFWNATIRVSSGDEAYVITIRDGRITESTPAAPDAAADVAIATSEEVWAEILKPIPRPFYNDLTGSMIHHSVTMTGDTDALLPYYGAWRRIVDLMRAAAGGDS